MIAIQRLAFAERIDWKSSKEMFIKEIEEILDDAFETAGKIFDCPIDMEDVKDLMIVPSAHIQLAENYKSSVMSFFIQNPNAKEAS